MKKIQMVDLVSQYEPLKEEIQKKLSSLFETASFINGPSVDAFVKNLSQYLNIEHVIPCANGTDALQMILMALNLKEGDEIIVPSFTFIATAEVIALLKLKAVFVDIDPRTFCMDASQVASLITPRTKAIIPVHLFGQAAAMDEIMQLAEKHHLFVIEDNAQAIGAKYKKKKTGTLAHASTTSFFPSKNLGAYGDGGAMMTHNAELAKQLQMIANHGQSRRYYHDVVGCNSRLDALQAAILDIKLKHLDHYNDRRRKAAAAYTEQLQHLDGVITPFVAAENEHVFHQYTLQVEPQKRDALIMELAKREIPAMVYYPVPCHQQKMFETSAFKHPPLKVTEKIAQQVISLPMHSELSEAQIQYICEHFIKIYTHL